MRMPLIIIGWLLLIAGAVPSVLFVMIAIPYSVIHCLQYGCPRYPYIVFAYFLGCLAVAGTGWGLLNSSYPKENSN